MHFGRSNVAVEREHEAALIACLQHFQHEVEHLILLGDVYDQYIEYKNLMPKGIARFQGLLAAWTDSGRRVTYLTGNHDPWHIDYFETELGVETIFDSFTEPLNGKHVYLNHGDVIASRFPLNAFLKRLLQHPVPVYLYRTLLPGDAGYRLARWVNQKIHSDVINEDVVRQLRGFATETITSNAYDLVVMGHSHHAELTSVSRGAYLNTGCWRLHRTFACMDNDIISLYEWQDETSQPKLLNSLAVAPATETSP